MTKVGDRSASDVPVGVITVPRYFRRISSRYRIGALTTMVIVAVCAGFAVTALGAHALLR